MTTSPAISVLLPFHNAAPTLAAALASCLSQSITDLEVLAVDDGSRDESADIVRSFAAHDERVRLIQPGRLGLVGALNHGLALARAPLVARMDADDVMYPERLRQQHEFMVAHPSTGLCGCRVRVVPEERVEAGFREYIRWQNACVTPAQIAEEIYWESPIAHPTFMFRRDVVVRTGGYRHGDFPEDYELLLRLHSAGVAMAKVPEVLLDWADSPGRATRTDPRYAREAFDRLRAAHLAEDARLHERPLVIWGAGRRTRQRVNLLLDRGFQPTTWIDIDPKKIGNVIRGATVRSPAWLDRSEKPFVLAYVTAHGARELIGDQLQAFGYRRGRDYLMVG
ncbi:MAG: glycosyltransferase family 2 protein [Thiohalomonadaceae bacterium]